MSSQEEPSPLDFGNVEVLFVVAFVLVGLMVLSGFLFVGYTIFRSSRAATRAGLDPFASEAQVIAQAISGPARTLEQRLRELDDLHRRGVISSDEHRVARAQLLGGG